MRDERKALRYFLRWRAAMIFEGNSGDVTIEGKTYDVSISGASILTQQPVPGHGRITLVLALPQLVSIQPHRIMTVQARLIYSMLTGEHMCFRTGVQFLNFQAQDRHFLEKRLAVHVPAVDYSR